jgi:hypothetical protein
VGLETEVACRIAALAAGKIAALNFVQTYSYYPRGCYYITSSNSAYFNTHAVGAGAASYQLICAALCDGCTAGACPMPRESASATRGMLGLSWYCTVPTAVVATSASSGTHVHLAPGEGRACVRRKCCAYHRQHASVTGNPFAYYGLRTLRCFGFVHARALVDAKIYCKTTGNPVSFGGFGR